MNARQAVLRVDAGFTREEIGLRVAARGNGLPSLPGVERRGRLLEKEFGRKLLVRRAAPRREAA